jgi:hypothetical protein
MFLSLPAFTNKIPSALESRANHENNLRFALAMSRCGMIWDEEVVNLSAGGITQTALHALIAQGWRHTLGRNVEYAELSACTRIILPRDGCSEWTGIPDKVVASFAVYPMQCQNLAVGDAFSSIEALQLGLGQSALRVLEVGLSHFCIPFSPLGAFEMSQRLYWEYEENESRVLEEYGEEAADVPRRAELFNGVPEWAYTNYPKELPDEAFEEAVMRFSGTGEGKLLKALLRLMQAEANPAGFVPPSLNIYGEQAECYTPPAALGWNEANDFMRVFDDFYHYQMESGEGDDCAGVVHFPPTVEGISESLGLICNTCSILKAIDECLIEIRSFGSEL